MDGCIYNWMKSGLSILGVDENDPSHFEILSTEHDAPDIICGHQRVYDLIEQSGYQFWANLELFPWSKSLFYQLQQIAPVTFLTSPGGWIDAGKGKAIALKRDFNVSDFILTRAKNTIANANCFLVDDKPENIHKFIENDGSAFLWPNQYILKRDDPQGKNAIKECINAVLEAKQKYELYCKKI